jgi:hypothetical protein
MTYSVGLTTVAQQLGAGNRDWAWWQVAPHTFPTHGARLAARTAIVLLFGLAYGPVFMLAGGLAWGLAGDPWEDLSKLAEGLVAGLVVGSACGLAVARTVRLSRSINPKNTNTRVSGRTREFIKSIARGLSVSLFIGLFGLSFGASAGQGVGLTVGLVLWLVGTLAIGLADFLGRGDVAQQAMSPCRSYRGDRALAFISALAIVLAFTLASGLAGEPELLIIGLAFGLAAAPAFG